MEIRINRNALRFIYFLIFAISGFSGLIYENIWTDYLKLFLGCAAYAQTLVLVIFMGGMAIGSWIAGKYSTKIPNLLIGYALVEGLVGILALLFHPLFKGVTSFAYISVIPELHSPFFIALLKWSIAALLILPQTILLGSTFPLMTGGIIRMFPEQSGKSISILYFTNSLGAVIGILVSGYFLVNRIGLPGTILTAGLINILLALIVWLLRRITFKPLKESLQNVKRESVSNLLSKKIFILLMLCACFTGVASFLYEIGWIRMLSLVLGSSTHAFELMLSAFILGLAIGGFWIRKRIDNLRNPLRTLGLIQLAMGFLALTTIFTYGKTFSIMKYALLTLTKTDQGYYLFNIFSHGICLLVMLPATIFAGMTLPIITYYLLKKGYGEGAIGRTYASNTIGAIIGVVIGVQVIMPILGVKNLITIGCGIDIILGLYLLFYAAKNIKMKAWYFAGIFSLIFIIVITILYKFDTSKMISGVFRTGKSSVNEEVLYYKDGRTATVALTNISNDIKTIRTNGKPDASIGYGSKISMDEPTQVLTGVLSWALADNVKTVASIGIGSGVTSHLLLEIPSIEKLDIIEIEPAMVEGAKGFGERVRNNFTDPRCKIFIEDAKTFFNNHNKKYDLIISEPSNPWVSGIAGLFTLEFYQLIQNYLNTGGIFVQWLQLYEMNTPLIASIMKAFSLVFDNYDLYAMDYLNIMILGSDSQRNEKLNKKVFDFLSLKNELARIGVYSEYDLYIRKLGNKSMLDPLFNSYDIAPNSDYFPILDNGAVKSRFLSQNAFTFHRLRLFPAPLVEVFTGQVLPEIKIEEIDSNTNSLHLAKGAKQAKFILDYFKKEQSNKNIDVKFIDPAILKLLPNVQAIHYHDDIGDWWITCIRDLSARTLPYLSLRDLQFIWEDIQSAKYYNTLTDSIKHWVTLYKALGNRDYKRVIKISESLLPPGKIDISIAQNGYLLTVNMLARLTKGEYGPALSLWDRFGEKDKAPIELRLIYEHVKQAISKG